MVKTSSVKLSLGMNPGFIIMILNRSNSRRGLDTKRHHLRKISKCFLPHGRCFSRSFGTVRVWFTQNFWNKANSTTYVNTLEKLEARLRRVRSEKVSIIHHDNARPHTSLETRTALDCLGLRTLPVPAL